MTALYRLIAQDATQGPIVMQTGTEQEIRDAYRVAMRNLETWGIGGYYQKDVRDFAIERPAVERRERTAEADRMYEALTQGVLFR